MVAQERQQMFTELCASSCGKVNALTDIFCEVHGTIADDLHEGRHEAIKWVCAQELIVFRQAAHERYVRRCQSLQLFNDLTWLLVPHLERRYVKVGPRVDLHSVNLLSLSALS